MPEGAPGLRAGFAALRAERFDRDADRPPPVRRLALFFAAALRRAPFFAFLAMEVLPLEVPGKPRLPVGVNGVYDL
jgi:hypothetical protein